MPNSPSSREIVEYGLGAVPNDSVEVSLRDLVFVHQVLGELVRFFHQPLHYPDLQSVQAFLGSRGSGGAFDVLAEAYYTRVGNMLPSGVRGLLEEGELDHPAPPEYFKHDA